MMKAKYKIGEVFSFNMPDIIIITGILITRDFSVPIYEMSRIDSYDLAVRKLYGYLLERELDELKHIEI